MAQFSKEQLSFVEEIPKQIDIECPVCLNILTEPHQVTCCGHIFCESCIERVKAGDGACPMCNKEKCQSFADKKCLRDINGLQVYCLNQKKGCQWKGELKCLSTHTNQGKREGECLYEEAKCRYEECGSKGQRHHLDFHEKNSCPQRPFKCAHCNTKGTHCFITQEHLKICSKVPTLCPNKCTDALMPKDSVPAHLPKCPLQPVDCVFSWAGCKERPLRKDTELHTTDTKHMMILAVICEKLQKEDETHKRTCDTLLKTCDQLKKENETLKKTCDQLQSENDALKKEHAHTHDLLGVVVADKHILPIIVIQEGQVVYFYTEIGGYYMSAAFMSHTKTSWLSSFNLQPNIPPTVYLAFHKGKFDKMMKHVSYPQICFIHDDTTYPFEIKSYHKVPIDALSSFLDSSETSTVPAGIISWTHPRSESDRHRRYKISSLRITLMERNKLAVHVKSRHLSS